VVSTAGNYPGTLRDDRDFYARLALALLISLLLHGLIYTGYRLNRHYRWLDHVSLPAWLKPAQHFLSKPAPRLEANPTPELTLVPMEFVEVNPATAAAEAPKEAKYYSTANSHAANPKAERESNVPKITGSETRIVRTETVTKPAAQPLRPIVAPAKPTPLAPATAAPKPPAAAVKPPEAAPKPPEAVTKPPEAVTKPPEAVTKPPEAVPKPPEAAPKPPEAVPKPPKAVPKPPAATPPRTQEALEELKPKAAPAPGDLTLARPADVVRPGEGQANQPRPRTLKEAYARLAARDPAAAAAATAGLVGQQMKQDGGVKRRSLISSLDVKASPFGAYDAAIIYAVQNRWYSLLDAKGYAGESTGKVTLKFRLHADGRVDQMEEREQTVDDLLSIICQRAILDNAPFDRWPSDMRRLNGSDYRDVTFTFYYQ
jgi:hypothetical protein